MQQGLTDIVVVLDRSGSMATIRTDMEGALAGFVLEQQYAPGQVRLSLHQFDDQFETIFEARPMRDVPGVRLLPRGSTALLDAVGRSVMLTEERYRGTPSEGRPDHVIFIIISDGQDNASRDFDLQAVRNLIRAQAEQWGWKFGFLGANPDEFANAAMNFEMSAESVESARRSSLNGNRYEN